MGRLLRGEIVWADLNPFIGHEQGGLRPVLIISDTYFNQNSGTVFVLAITSQLPKERYPLTKRIDTAQMPKKSWVKISQIRTISIKRIKGSLAIIDENELDEIIRALHLITKKGFI